LFYYRSSCNLSIKKILYNPISSFVRIKLPDDRNRLREAFYKYSAYVLWPGKSYVQADSPSASFQTAGISIYHRFLLYKVLWIVVCGA